MGKENIIVRGLKTAANSRVGRATAGLLVLGEMITGGACVPQQVQAEVRPAETEVPPCNHTAQEITPIGVGYGADRDEIIDAMVKIRRKIESCQPLTPQEIQAVQEFNDRHPVLGVVTEDGRFVPVAPQPVKLPSR